MNKTPNSEEDPLKLAAKILGRRGGLKGGPIRANSLTPERRKEIAANAAKARWKRSSNTNG